MAKEIIEYEQKQNQRLKESKIILSVGVLLVLISPYLFTRGLGWISFENTGPIGDTIGGITAPIVNLIGAILVYYAFLVQIDANKLILQQIKDEKEEQKINQNRNYVFEVYKLLKEEFSTFSIQEEKQIGSSDTKRTVMVEYKGLEAINKMLSNLMSDHRRFVDDLYKLKEFENMVDLLKKFLITVKETALHPIDKKFFLESVEYIYLSKIKASIEELIKPCTRCGKVHGDNPDKLTDLANEIEVSINQIKKSYT